ncbi:hypothetical protein D3C81_2223290 [compost metagenome]
MLVVQVALGLLLRLLRGMQLLGEAGSVFLQGKQGALALLVLLDLIVQAPQLAVQPDRTGLVVLWRQGRPEGV